MMTKNTASSSIPSEVWRVSGSSEHMGGVGATRRLLEMCAVSPGERVLDIGCGTGGTIVLLALEYGVRVLGVDLTRLVLERARERIEWSGAAEHVQLMLADGGCLPFCSAAFDCAIVESVMVHSEAGRLLVEIGRVLNPGGRLGVNEMTYLDPPSKELEALLGNQLGIKAHQPKGWEAVFEKAGLRMTAQEVRPFSLWEQLRGHIEADGLRGYLSALIKGISSARLRGAFLNREMLQAARRFASSVGYGLYVAEKPLS